jgi:hypothetical protein
MDRSSSKLDVFAISQCDGNLTIYVFLISRLNRDCVHLSNTEIGCNGLNLLSDETLPIEKFGQSWRSGKSCRISKFPTCPCIDSEWAFVILLWRVGRCTLRPRLLCLASKAAACAAHPNTALDCPLACVDSPSANQRKGSVVSACYMHCNAWC